MTLTSEFPNDDLRPSNFSLAAQTMPPKPQSESYQQPRANVLQTRGRRKESYMNDSVYQVITDRIVSLLEAGTVPWQKSWNGGDQAPQNLISRKHYRGVNVFLLHAMHYASPFWL